MLHCYSDLTSDAIEHIIKISIVENIISDLFFHLEPIVDDVPETSMRISASYMVFIIDDQWSSTSNCFRSLCAADVGAVLNKIVVYTEKLVIFLPKFAQKNTTAYCPESRTRLLFYLLN